MQQELIINEHWLDIQDKPAGGCTCGRGFTISWQNGLLGRGDNRQEPNGAFVEDIIKAAIKRIDFYEEAGFGCEENRKAIAYLNQALFVLDQRTQSREKAGVKGTHGLRPEDDQYMLSQITSG